jgi:ribonucleotide monophosphatase NagD (HAD superfamily)
MRRLESDIDGGNSFDSPRGVNWYTILVETGVYTGGKPLCEPTATTRDVYEAVQWALKQQAWQPSLIE